MKKLKIFFIVIFFMLLAIPVVTFRTEENAVSEVDNRDGSPPILFRQYGRGKMPLRQLKIM